MSEPESPKSRIDALAATVADEFQSTRRVLSFDEWFELLCRDPRTHARSAPQYLLDALDYFGK